jgi:hypothetical protein
VTAALMSMWLGTAAGAADGNLTSSSEGPTLRCDLSGAPEARFRVPVQSDRVRLLIEVWPNGADPAWGPALLDVLDARGLSATVAVPAAPPDAASGPLLDRVRGTDHQVAVVVGRGLVPADKAAVKALKRAVEPVSDRAGKVRTIIAPTGSRGREAMIGKAGFRNLLDAKATGEAGPRMAGHFEGQQRVNVVFPSGTYEDACGPDPKVGPFTPAAADRVGLALQRAARTPGTPVVRLALNGSAGAASDAEVLGRWLDEIVAPAGVRVVTADQARHAALQSFRRPPVTEDLPEVGGRLVSLDEIGTAAGALEAGASVLPRTLPGDLNPTEAYFAFALVLADRTEGEVVRLGALHGPAQLATSTLSAPVEVDRAAVAAVASALVGAMPSEVPAALSFEGRLLTASETLLAFASAVRGDDPVTTRPIAAPEPNERGLGWGDATVP